MKLLDFIFEGKTVEFVFNGYAVSGICELETKNTLVIKGKVYPKSSIKSFLVEGKRVPRYYYGKSVEERLKRVMIN
ncbi:MAG: hypothetical protein ACP5T2_00315 [Thermoprotei archaeon]